MNGRNSISGGLILCALLSFGYGLWIVGQSRKDLSIASREATSTASLTINFNDPLKPRSEGPDVPYCRYNFKVSDVVYRGGEKCPGRLIYAGAVDALNFRSVTHQETVYYDPSDPQNSSLIDFKEKSDIDGKGATLSFGIGALSAIFAVLAFVLTMNQPDAVAGIPPGLPQAREPSPTEFMKNLDNTLAKERHEDN